MSELSQQEVERLKRIGDHCWNLLGMTDPQSISEWIAGACDEIAQHRAREQAAQGRVTMPFEGKTFGGIS